MMRKKLTRRNFVRTGVAAGGSAVLSAAAPEAAVLESDRWRLELSPEGAVARFLHKPSGQVLLEAGSGTPAYELLTPTGIRRASGARVSREEIRANDRRGYRFRSEDAGITVTMEVAHVLRHGGLEFGVRVENSTDAVITAIRYPILLGPPKLGARAEDNVILLPFFEGGIVENPSKEFESKRISHSAYPGPASCQLVAYYNKTAGVYVAPHDAHGHGKLLGATQLAGGRFDLTVAHLQPRAPRKQIRVGYPVVVDSFTGDWFAAAEKYRNWSLRQWWSRERLATSKKTPQWIRAGAIMAEYDPTRTDLKAQRQWFEQLREWFQVAVVPNNRGWERYGMWTSSEYLPPRPNPEEFRASAALIKEVGGRGLIMLSGYRWTLVKPQPGGSTYDSQDRFQREVAPHAQCGTNGQPQIWTSQNAADWHGTKWARLCRAAEFTKKLNLEVARYCVEAGYPIIHWDQENCGAYSASVCYSESHGHPPGDGQWLHLEMEDLYKRFLKELGPLTPDFALSMEESCELYMPYLTMAQQRPFANGREWPAATPMTQSVPLLMYLHHEHLFGWAAYYPWRTTPDGIFYSLAKGFSAGLMPGIAQASISQFRRQSPELLDRYLKLFKSCMEGYRGYARDALMYGRMMRPLDLNLTAVSFQFKGVPPQSFPVVLNSAWLTPDGRTMIVFINHTLEEHSFEADLSEAFGWTPARRAQWVDASGGKPLEGARPRITVPPLSMGALEFGNRNPLPQQ